MICLPQQSANVECRVNIIKQSKQLSKRQIEDFVCNYIDPAVVDDMVKYVHSHEPTLHGQRPDSLHEWREDMTFLFLFREITGTSFIEQAFNLNYPYYINHKSLAHNIATIRHILGAWGRSKVVLGNLDSWRNAAINCHLDPLVKDTLLWIDSFDIQVEGRSSVGKRSDRWSYRLNRPGRRYMTVRDGRGRIVKVWGGYSPKAHDGFVLSIMKDDVLSRFDGSCIIGDNHFTMCKKIFKDRIKFHTNYVQRSNTKTTPGVDSDEDYVERITQANLEFNEQHQKARELDNPYEWAITIFGSLRSAWRESDEHLDDMMMFTFGLCNVIINGL